MLKSWLARNDRFSAVASLFLLSTAALTKSWPEIGFYQAALKRWIFDPRGTWNEVHLKDFAPGTVDASLIQLIEIAKQNSVTEYDLSPQVKRPDFHLEIKQRFIEAGWLSAKPVSGAKVYLAALGEEKDFPSCKVLGTTSEGALIDCR